MRLGIVESFLIVLPRLALLAIVILLVVIVIQNMNKNKADKPKKEQPRVGYGMNDEKPKTDSDKAGK